jgi:Fe-S-cluster-containing hydrogenase component 2/CRP-like cAMP-binding protein
MPDPIDLPDDAPRGRDEEAVFARDANDALVRRETATREQFADTVVVTLDGYPVTVPKAVPATDSQGNERRAADGGLVPRNTTIYDAALRLVRDGTWTDADLRDRIPVLCHQPHLPPVGVCRMCAVQIQQVKRGKARTERRLLPACHHPVAENMVVTTRLGDSGYNPAAGPPPPEVGRFAAKIRASTAVLAELLLADHRRPDPTPARRYEDELEAVAATLGVAGPRPRLAPIPVAGGGRNALHLADPRSRRIALPVADVPVEPERLLDPAARFAWEEWNALVDVRFPYSSRTVVVDHDRCILCDRCVRACSDVKPFKVIGHTGKGYNSRVSFDLDEVMGLSSCVQCGECMTACPTGALSLRRRVQPRAWDDSPTAIPLNPNTPFPPGSDFLSADEVRAVSLRYTSPSRGPHDVFPFRTIPYAYLKWNEGAVRRRVIRAGERRVLCRQGEFGTTAFLLAGTGRFHIHVRDAGPAAAAPGFLARLLGRATSADPDPGPLRRTLPGDQLVVGEMACLTHRPREATVVAEADAGGPDVVVYEVTRNLLDMMQRSAAARADLEEVYTRRALENALRAGRLFAGLTADQRRDVADFLLATGRLEFRRVDAGQTIVAEGDPSGGFYLVRLGTVRVFRTVGGQDRVLTLLKANDSFGEVALLTPELRARGLLPPGAEPQIRTATVAALDPVELVRVPGDMFRQTCARFPAVRDALVDRCAALLAGGSGPAPPPGALGEFVELGLYQGQRVLALDLTRCTRCDECTRACADSHDGTARLLREGLRFGDFLVATSCRSCHKPYCMEGCPVDAIHRDGTRLEVKIEDHCIGCGLCERNCPYGAIHMVPRTEPNPAALGVPGGDPQKTAAPRRAVNCDLCGPVGGAPYCVSACPHDAAFRWTGETLLGEVTRRAGSES